jgi:hypothetical protein
MRPDELSHQADTRAEPLPEERAAEQGGEDRRAEAAEILRDSEERVEAATDADAPGEAADEHRHSEDTVP